MSTKEATFARRWFPARLFFPHPQRLPLWVHLLEVTAVMLVPILPLWLAFFRARRKAAAKLRAAAQQAAAAAAAAGPGEAAAAASRAAAAAVLPPAAASLQAASAAAAAAAPAIPSPQGPRSVEQELR